MYERGLAIQYRSQCFGHPHVFKTLSNKFWIVTNCEISSKPFNSIGKEEEKIVNAYIIIVDGQKFIDEDNNTNKEGLFKGVHNQATSKLGFEKFELESQMSILKLWNRVWVVFIWPSKLDPFKTFENDLKTT